jgi:hypothetical protein
MFTALRQLIMNMPAAYLSETSVILYQTTPCHVQEDDGIRVKAAVESKLARYDLLFCWVQKREMAVC